MTVEEALTDEAILNTRDVMRQLRPAVQPDAYLDTVRPMMQTDGYHLAARSHASLLLPRAIHDQRVSLSRRPCRPVESL